jgi:hemolysin activation/secretion protein
MVLPKKELHMSIKAFALPVAFCTMLSALPAHAHSQPSGNTECWDVMGVPADIDMSGIDNCASPREVAVEVISRIRNAGFLSYYIQVDSGTQSIHALSASNAVSGGLSDYLPNELNSRSLTAKMPLMREAARAQAGVPRVNVGKVESGVIPVTAEIEPSTSRISSGITVSSHGSRYAATDTASLFVYGSPANGLLLSASASHGLSDLRDESEGGRYNGAGLTLEAPTPYGIPGVSYRISDSVQGGGFAPLDIGQKVQITDAHYRYPFAWGQLKGGVKHVNQEMVLGIVDFNAEQSYTALHASAEHLHSFGSDAIVSGRLKFEHELTLGLSQKTTGLLYGLAPDDHWMTYAGMVSFEKDWSQFSLNVTAGGQWSDSDVLPNNETFFMGGPGRGSAYYPGVVSSHSGWYSSLTMYGPPVTKGSFKFRPYGAYSYSTGPTLAVEKVDVQSVELGVKLNIADEFFGEIGYAKAIDHGLNIDYDDRVLFNLTYLF